MKAVVSSGKPHAWHSKLSEIAECASRAVAVHIESTMDGPCDTGMMLGWSTRMRA